MLSVVVPVYNEASALAVFLPRLRAALDELPTPYEVIAVDDGSVDRSLELLRSAARDWDGLRVLTLGRNRGHQVALMSGLRASTSEVVVTLDSDGQHPPEVLDEALRRLRDDALDVLHLERTAPTPLPLRKRLTSRLFYVLIARLTDGGAASVGDFRLITRRVNEALQQLAGPVVIRAALPQLGFPSGVMTYREGLRAAGTTKYTTRRMVRLAIDAVLNVSTRPLLWASSLAFGLTGLAVLWAASVIVTFLLGRTVPGWASVMVAVLTIGALQLGVLAVFGQYLARVYDVVLQRHDPVVREVTPGEGAIDEFRRPAR